jgi:hypothetical protein
MIFIKIFKIFFIITSLQTANPLKKGGRGNILNIFRRKKTDNLNKQAGCLFMGCTALNSMKKQIDKTVDYFHGKKRKMVIAYVILQSTNTLLSCSVNEIVKYGKNCLSTQRLVLK